jgi:CelD/BcsL family acetyltransferase involved in cellulose biosynthesis
MIHRLPVAYRGLLRLSSLSFVGHGFTDNSDFLITRNREVVIKAFLDYVSQNENRWDEIRLAQFSDASPNFDLVKGELGRKEYDFETTLLIRSPYIQIEGEFEPYYKRLGKNLKHDIDKKLRRLAEKGVEPDFETVTCIEEKHLEELRELNRKRFEATQHRSFLLNGERYNFVRELAKTFNANQWSHLFLFRVKGQLVAYRLCFAYNDTIFDWNTSYDVDYFQYSLGKILLKPVLSYCFEKGFRVFDFMAGDEDYKLKWTESMRSSYQIVAQKRNLKTRFARIYSETKKRIKKQ